MNVPAEKTAAASVGERLRAARDRQGLTLQKISEDLHLDVPVLEAMEENRFRALGAPVYARGHLRKYASLLGLDVGTVLADYEAAHSGPVEPNLVPSITEHPAMPPVRAPGGPRWGMIAAIVGAAIVVAAAAWWYFGPHRLASSSAAPAAQAVAAMPPPAAVEPSLDVRAAEKTSTKPPAAMTHKGHTAPPAGTTPVPAGGRIGVMTPVPAGGTARLGMRFQSESWVEIYDARGARLLFDERDADSVRTVAGLPPFKVLLGNYDGVEITLNGRSVRIPERARYGATARFRVMADATARASWGNE
jgi:cytoskeleton protein RodZ